MSTNYLSPKDNNEYLTSFLRNQNLTKNSFPVALDTGNFTSSAGVSVNTFGDGQMFLEGQVTTIGTPSANYAIGTLSANLIPTKNSYPQVTVLRSGAAVNNALSIVPGQGNSISGATITTPGSYAAIPTISVTTSTGSGAILSAVVGALSAAIVTRGTGYVPGDTIVAAGGTFSPAATISVLNTQVVSAAIAAGGTGGTPGTQTVTGTTGTGTKFQASVTVSAGGVITAILSITLGGTYSVNPTNLAAEPVTGAGLTGATLTIVMGVGGTPSISVSGAYTAIPANPVAQASTSGAGTGASFNLTWKLVSINVTNGGVGYATTDTASISGGGAGVIALLFAQALAELTLINAPTVGDVVELTGISFFVQPYN